MSKTALLFLILATPCSAQVIHKPFIGDCYPYADVEATLAMHGEISYGPTLVDGTAVEDFIGRARGSLTTVQVYPSGLTCYRSFGSGWGVQPRNMTPG